MHIPVNQLAETFAVLTPDLAIRTVPVTPTVYDDLDTSFGGFTGHVLISMHEFDADWPTWEKHPAGDEVVLLLSGRATLVLRTRDGDQTVELVDPGTYVVVPRGTWHTARISSPTRMMFVTPGEDTENREAPAD